MFRKQGAESDEEVRHNQGGCESVTDVSGLLLCCSSFFQRLDVTEERKRGQNRVKLILSYSLAEKV